MQSEAYKRWEEALNGFRNAEDMLKNGNFQKAAEEADWSVLSGCRAINKLSKELEIPDLSEISSNASFDWFERREKHYTPTEIVEWARSTLKRLHAATPQNTFQPLR